MSVYALVKGGMVINTILWEGPSVAPMDFDKGVTAVEVTEGVTAGIGYSYSKGVFTPPPLTEEEKAAIDEAAKNSNINTKEILMSEATMRISVLQDAVDLEMATDEESAALPLWKKYRVLLSRVDANTPGDLSWPDKPQYPAEAI